MIAPPTFESPDAYTAIYRDPDFWRPYIDAALAQSGLQKSQTLEDPIEGTNVVFTVDGKNVIKIFTPFFNGDRQQGIERLTLETLAQYPELQTPKLLGSGELFPNEAWPWEFVITERVDDLPLNKQWQDLSVDQRTSAAQEAGRYMSQLHSIPVPEDLQSLIQKRIGQESFTVAWAKDVKARVLRHGVPAHLAEQAPEYVQRWLPKTGRECILHGDLSADHLLGSPYEDGWRLKAVIDYGDLKLGNPVYDLVPLHFDTFQADKQLLRACLQAYGEMPEFSPHVATSFSLIHEWDVMRHAFKIDPRFQGLKTIEELCELVWS